MNAVDQMLASMDRELAANAAIFASSGVALAGASTEVMTLPPASREKLGSTLGVPTDSVDAIQRAISNAENGLYIVSHTMPAAELLYIGVEDFRGSEEQVSIARAKEEAVIAHLAGLGLDHGSQARETKRSRIAPDDVTDSSQYLKVDTRLRFLGGRRIEGVTSLVVSRHVFCMTAEEKYLGEEAQILAVSAHANRDRLNRVPGILVRHGTYSFLSPFSRLSYPE